jgi:aromatic-L-amino-acid decarboxylase
MSSRLREHVRLARLLASWVDADPDWERLAPVPFSTVCLRYAKGDDLDAVNEAILGRVNAGGKVFLSHTKLRGRYTLRVALGNPRQTEEHVAKCWAALKDAAPN